MAYRGRKSSEFDKLQKENSQMKSVIENLRKQNMALNQQDDQDKFSSFVRLISFSNVFPKISLFILWFHRHTVGLLKYFA